MARATATETQGQTALRLKNEGKGLAEIAETMGIGQGKVAYLILCETVDPKDRITFKDDNDLAKKAIQARNSGLSWGIISARTGVPESKLRRLFEAGGGGSALGNRIGKGGRHPGSSNGTSPSTTTAAKKAGAKKAAAPAKAAAKKAAAAVGDMTLAQLKQRLDGKKIQVDPQSGGPIQNMTVVSVTRLKDGEVTFKEADGGKTRTVLLTQIKKVSK